MALFFSRKVFCARARLKTVSLTCEQLEARQLMATDLASIVATDVDAVRLAKLNASPRSVISLEDQLADTPPSHGYFADGQSIPMIVYPSRLALKLADDVDESALTELGIEFERMLNSEYSVYASVDGSALDRHQLISSGLVEDAVSVFFVQASRSEAVLLDEIIVALKPGVTAEEYFANNPLFSSYKRVMGTPDNFVATVADGPGEVALHVANALRQDERLQFTAPNFHQNWQRYFTPNDPRFGNLWHLSNTGQGGGLVDADSDLPEAWDVNPGGSSAIVIGVVDDGVDEHPDLNRWRNPGELEEGLDNDGNGWADDINGWNFVSDNVESNNSRQRDRHGTAVAGVAAARGNNGLGVTGAAYNSRVLSAKIFEGTIATTDAMISSALFYAAGRTADGQGSWKASDVVNSSWGGGTVSTAINAALDWGLANGNLGKGVAFVFATGNSNTAVSYPAVLSLTKPGIIAVGATNNRGTRSNYSNFGPAVDVVAPSDDARTGYLAIDTTDRLSAEGYSPDDYTGTGPFGFGGTSSAAPLVSGIAALTLAQASIQNVVLSPADLRSYLRANTDYAGTAPFNLTTGRNDEFGYGRLNAFSAVSNLGKPEISVVLSNGEVQAGGTIALGTVYVDEVIDTVVRIRNQGTSPLSLSPLTLNGSGPFALLTGLGATTLAMGEGTTFSLRFAPTAAGTLTQSITINSNDANEAAFTFTLSAQAVAPTISGYVFEDWDGDNNFDTPDLLRPSQQVYIDANNNGTLDFAAISFVNNTPMPLVDNGLATSSMVVAGLTSPVADVNVRINLTHTWVSDMLLTLVSPSGTRVVLSAFVGAADADDMTNAIFDDEAATSINSASAPFTGTFRPQQPLSAFDNANGNGTWTLELEDTFAIDTGVLLEWELIISVPEPSQFTRPSGMYGFLNLPVGSYSLRLADLPGWTAVVPANSVSVAATTDVFKTRNFGIGKNDRMYAAVFDDYNVNGVWDPAEAGLAGRTLVDDVNNNGVNEGGLLVGSVAPALFIPDLTTRTSTVTIGALPGPISDVNVKVNFTMPLNADLDVFLIAPDGTRVELFTDVGGAGQNFIDTVLDDQATTLISAGAAPFTGSYRPEGSLATLNGKVSTGIWTLEVTDDTPGQSGTLNSWELSVYSGNETNNFVPASGYGFFDLPTGSHNVLLSALAGWRYTLPSNGTYVVNAAGAPIFQRNYGTRLNNRDPTDVALSNGSVLENQASGTTVGNLSSIDPDFGNTFSYALVAGAGDTGNGQFTLEPAGTLKTAAAFNFETAPSYSIRVRSTDQDGLFFEKSFTINVTDLLEMSGGVVLGNGSAQRSQIDKLVVTFDGGTTFDPGAFTLEQRGVGGGVVTINLATATTGSGQTVATLTFSGPRTRGPSGILNDGYYQLTIDGTKVRRGGQTLDVNGDGVGGDAFVLGAVEADNFFSLFGDTSGDGLVSVAEFGQFRSSFGKTSADSGYNVLFDFERDASVGVSDFGQFRSRFGKPKIAFS